MRGSGGANGPDLTYIGSQRPAGFLRASILDPSAAIWNNLVLWLHWNQRAYRGDVFYCLAMSGDAR